METESDAEMTLHKELLLWQSLGLQAWEMFDYTEDGPGTAQCE